MPDQQLQIITGPNPDPITQHAANELASYVDRLFHIQSLITPAPVQASTPFATIFLDSESCPVDAPAEPQSYRLERFTHAGQPAFAALGASPRATLWAVYDLVEQWGVRYLLRGDVFPTTGAPFHVPDLRVTRQPNLNVRGFRLINDFSMGPESWSLADLCRVIDQLAKLRFNQVYHHLWCWQPYIHYECRGIAKSTGVHWFNWHYPINENTIGRQHFRHTGEFVPPDFQNCRTYQERVEVGTYVARESLAHAARRGMQAQINTGVTDFPVEFFHALGQAPTAHHGMGVTITGGHKGADDPAFQDFCAAVLRAHVDTYPDADTYGIAMPEFSVEHTPYKEAWDRLDKKYNISKTRTLDQVLADAAARTDFGGGADRVVRNNKGDIVSLDLFDRLLNENKILDDSAKPDADIIFTQISEELADACNAIKPGDRFFGTLDYTTSRMVKRPEALRHIREAGLSPVAIMTTQDDNIGVIPQSATASIHDMLAVLRDADWEGFVLRYWMITEMDPAVAHIAAATWNAAVTREQTYQNYTTDLFGPPAVDEAIAAFDTLDQLTIELGDHALGIGFPVPQMSVQHWYGGDGLSEQYIADRDQYRVALAHARAARSQATRGHQHLDFFIGRLEFGIGFFDMIQALCDSSMANQSGDRPATLAHLRRAVDLARRAVTIQADITLDATDLGTLAQLNEDVVARLTRLLDAVRAGEKWTFNTEAGASAVLVESDTCAEP